MDNLVQVLGSGPKAQGHDTSHSGITWTWHWNTAGAHGDNCEAQCGPAVRKKARFTHGRGNLRGDVSGKRFSTHVVEVETWKDKCSRVGGTVTG